MLPAASLSITLVVLSEDAAPNVSSTISSKVDAFEKQLKFLEDNGYEVVELSRIVEAVKNNEKPGEKWIAITVDDAYRSFYYLFAFFQLQPVIIY